MASVTRRLLLQSRRCPSSIPSRSTPKYTGQWQRPLSTTPSRAARGEREDDGPPREPAKPAKPALESTWANTPDKTAAQLQKLVEDLKQMDPEFVEDALRKGKQGNPIAQEYNLDNDADFDIAADDPFRIKTGFWAEGEESMGPDEDYFGDDITSHGHGELQKHRELREYARLIAWELPLLSRTSCLPCHSRHPIADLQQTSPGPSNRPQPPPPSASATPRTSANRTQPPTKSWSSFRPQTWASQTRSAPN